MILLLMFYSILLKLYFNRFYQVYLHALDGTPRRLHEWIPHGGKPVKKIMFLDNLNQSTTE